MNIPVLIDKVAGNGFSAETFSLRAQGTTRDEALSKLKQLLDAKLANGVEITSLEVPPADNPWLRMAGMYDPNDPMVQEWQQAMADYREQVERDPDYL